jgi:DNA-binding NarL/FixJ family response regulator
MKSSQAAAAEAPPSTPKRRVLIIDDHLVVRQGLKHLINREEDLVACGDAGDAREGLDAIRLLSPDIVLVDISLPGVNGLEFIKNAKACHPALPIVVFSMHDESLYAERVLRAGALGYVMKKADSEELITALRKALRGEIHTSGAVGGALLQRLLGRQSPKRDFSVSRLSDRELEVFELIGNGKTSREIAASLNLSIKTVDTHRMHVKEKLGLRTSIELVQHAVHHVENRPET